MHYYQTNLDQISIQIDSVANLKSALWSAVQH